MSSRVSLSRPVMWTLAASSITLAALVPSQSAGASTTVPFTDPSSNGTITLCGRNDQPVTSGSVDQQPFVWKAVASTPAPQGYTRAFLLLYQPLEHVDPSDWSGYQLTDDSVFSNTQHPAAQATNIDAALVEPQYQYSPYWDGLYQLRMYFTAPERATFNASYPTAVIKVTGKSWTLLSGGTASCSSGEAVSEASKIIAPAAANTPQTIVVGPKTTQNPSVTAGDSSGSGATGTTAASPNHSPSPGSATTAPSAEALGATREAGRGHPSGGSSVAALVAAAIGVVIAGGGVASAIAFRRRRRPAS